MPIEAQKDGSLVLTDDADPPTRELVIPAGTAAEERAAQIAAFFGAPATAPVPEAVTPLQARRALRAAGLTAAVDAWLATADEETREAWEYAVEVRRDDPVLVGAAAALGLTDAQLDDLFRGAAAR